MLKVVAESKSESDNVLNFPEDHTQVCRYAGQCPIRATFNAKPGLDTEMTSGFFVSASHGEIRCNGLTKVPDSDVGPLMRALGKAYRHLCQIHKKNHLKAPAHSDQPNNERWYT